jgi:hypothetical protein
MLNYQRVLKMTDDLELSNYVCKVGTWVPSHPLLGKVVPSCGGLTWGFSCCLA